MTSAPVFDIQGLATRDGPGIRTLVFLQGCPLRCTWCANPEGQEAVPVLRWRAMRCQASVACRTACQRGAVRVGADGRPVFARDLCRACPDRPCVEACCSDALSVVGRTMDVETLVGQLRRDLRFYWNSGGGVTFSGGEPLLYPEFVAETAARLEALGVPTAVETCGFWEWERALPAVLACDLVYFDVKSLDAEAHERFTGRSNRTILANLERLAEAGRRVVVSLPLVPGLQDTVEALQAVGEWMKARGLARARLMPYHRLGVDKYAALGRPYPHAAWDAPLARSSVEAMRVSLSDMGLAVDVEG